MYNTELYIVLSEDKGHTYLSSCAEYACVRQCQEAISKQFEEIMLSLEGAMDTELSYEEENEHAAKASPAGICNSEWSTFSSSV